jgi:hypothetical protein
VEHVRVVEKFREFDTNPQRCSAKRAVPDCGGPGSAALFYSCVEVWIFLCWQVFYAGCLDFFVLAGLLQLVVWIFLCWQVFYSWLKFGFFCACRVFSSKNSKQKFNCVEFLCLQAFTGFSLRILFTGGSFSSRILFTGGEPGRGSSP